MGALKSKKSRILYSCASLSSTKLEDKMKILYSCPINLRGNLLFEDANSLGAIVNIAVVGRPDINAPDANGVLVTAPWVSKDDEAVLSTAWRNIMMSYGITAALDVYEDGSTMVRYAGGDELRKITRKFRRDSRKLRVGA